MIILIILNDSQVYSVNIYINCVFSLILIISETGEGGMCFVSEISVGTKWVVFLSEYYNMRYKEQAFGDYTDIVQKGCDLRVKSTTPVGKSPRFHTEHSAD